MRLYLSVRETGRRIRACAVCDGIVSTAGVEMTLCNEDGRCVLAGWLCRECWSAGRELSARGARERAIDLHKQADMLDAVAEALPAADSWPVGDDLSEFITRLELERSGGVTDEAPF